MREAGIDYITVTSRTRNSDSGLDAFGRYLVEVQEQRAFKVRNYGAQGYRGLTAGHAAFGRRGDGCLVRITGSFADEHWNQAYALADNISRLDPQITVEQPNGCGPTIKKHYMQIRRRKTKGGRPSKYKLFVGEQGPEALTINRRVSDQFLRIYDKFIESGLPEYERCLRYEIEVKGSQAKSLALELDQAELWRALVVDRVNTFLGNRGVSAAIRYEGPRFVGVVNTDTTRNPAIATDCLRLSAWLHKCVRPSIERLVRQGFEREALEALGLVDYAQLS